MGIGELFFGKQKRDGLEPLPLARHNASKGATYRQRLANSFSEETALRVAAVCRAAEVRSNSVAIMKLRLLQWNKRERYMMQATYGSYGRENYILQVRPNSRQNAFQFWKRVEMMRMFGGHCYILPRYASDGSLLELIPCGGTWDATSNTYYLTETAFGINGAKYSAEEIIVLRGITTAVHPEGEGILHYAGRTATLASTIEDLSLESAAKGGRQKLIIQQKPDGGLVGLGGLDPVEMEEQAKKLEESIYNNDVIFDDSVSTITPINMNAVDLQLLDTRKFSVADIARFFGVPRALLMDDGNSSYKTPEAATLEFMSRTLTPIMREIESEFDAKMLVPEDFGKWAYRFDTKDLFALDISTMGTHNRNRLETGLASVNELRAEMNMPVIEGGDEHYVTCNVAPVGSVKLNGQPATGGGEPDADAGADADDTEGEGTDTDTDGDGDTITGRD